MDRLEALRAFVAIAEQGSLSGAANVLEIERTKVSRYLSELEEWVGSRLLHRTTRKQSLTDAGEQTLALAYQMLSLSNEVSAIRDRQNNTLSGKLRIASAYSLIEHFLLQAVEAFCAQWPEVQIELLVADSSTHLIEEGVDLAVRITNDLAPGLIARQMGVCRSALVATPAYLEQFGHPQQPSDLPAHRCLSFSYFGKNRWYLTRDNRRESIDIQGPITANISTIVLSATLHGSGISQQPYAAVAPHLAQGCLLPVLPDWQPDELGVYLVYSSRKQITPLHRQFIDFICQRMASDPLWQAL
ncbi:TPA: LysR family transcriptional regulator [Vibrio vulnificus]|nr:LysR family transcriptional regulator [Vibrio vulnificus]